MSVVEVLQALWAIVMSGSTMGAIVGVCGFIVVCVIVALLVGFVLSVAASFQTKEQRAVVDYSPPTRVRFPFIISPDGTTRRKDVHGAQRRTWTYPRKEL